MALDRGRLAKIDRKMFGELDHADGVQAVKVPVSNAVWSTWRRYCEALGLSMGDGVAGLILDELETVVASPGVGLGLLAEKATSQAEERASQLDTRQQQLDTQAEQLLAKEKHLRAWERRIQTRRTQPKSLQRAPKVGRNERCPCGSGLKYKQCHGLPGRTG